MQKHRIINYASAVLTVFTALLLTAGCAKQQKMFDDAKAAENSGDHRKAFGLLAALALESSRSLTLPEASKGKVIKPEAWMNDMNRYINWLTGPAAQQSGLFRDAIDGLDRTGNRFEPDNTFHTPASLPFDSPEAFAEMWNRAFNPPPPESADWDGLVKRAADLNFSIVRMSAPKNYTYDVNIINRKNTQRVNFTLYAENQTLIPLPPGEYKIIVRSNVDFQGGQRWISEFSAFDLTVQNERSLIPIDMRTRVARRESRDG